MAWTNGSSKWQTKTGWVGGYGATILGEWDTCASLPPTMKDTINTGELCAVLVVVKQFGSANRKLAVAIDCEYLYAGLQGAAYRWRDNGWVSATGLIADVDIWQQLLAAIQSSCKIFQWVKIPSHVGLHGTDVADELANRGRLTSPLYQSRRPPLTVPVGVAVCTPTPPRTEVASYYTLTVLLPPRPPYGTLGSHPPMDTPAGNAFAPGWASLFLMTSSALLHRSNPKLCFWMRLLVMNIWHTIRPVVSH